MRETIYHGQSAMYIFFVNLLQPLPLLFLTLGLAILVLGWRAREHRKLVGLVAILYVLLLLYCLPVVAYFAAGVLEGTYPPTKERPPQAEAIVVLDGGIIPPIGSVTETRLSENTLRRCLRGAELYRQGEPCPVVVSGGKVDTSKPGGPAGQAMRDFLVQLGVRTSDILVEDGSTDTYENAVRSKRLLGPRGITTIVLVTDATHLRRATRRFENQSLTVIPATSHYFTSEFDLCDSSAFLPRPRAAEINNAAVHELLGFAWDWSRGKQ